LLANLYLHHALDEWMNTSIPFERYADDIVIHCSTRQEAETLLKELETRMAAFSLTLHPEKTKIVYCKNYLRNEDPKDITQSFTFLSYTFRPRPAMDKFVPNKTILLFNASISNAAGTNIRQTIRKIVKPAWIHMSWELFAKVLNPKIRGWMNYYGKFFKKKVVQVFTYLDSLLLKWIKYKYRIHSHRKGMAKYEQYKAADPQLFYHWKF